jgi:hypothetical protein
LLFGDGHNPPALRWRSTITEARGGKLVRRSACMRFEALARALFRELAS